MKKISTSLAALFILATFIVSCEKGSSINDPEVPPGKGVTHPDSTIIEVTVAAASPATQLRMVGDMTNGPNSWTPASNAGCVVFDNAGSGVWRKQVPMSFFQKDDMEFKFLRATSWGSPNEEAGANRKVSKAALKGKVVKYTITTWN